MCSHYAIGMDKGSGGSVIPGNEVPRQFRANHARVDGDCGDGPPGGLAPPVQLLGKHEVRELCLGIGLGHNGKGKDPIPLHHTTLSLSLYLSPSLSCFFPSFGSPAHPPRGVALGRHKSAGVVQAKGLGISNGAGRRGEHRMPRVATHSGGKGNDSVKHCP
jgi:hypothetical protein